jgi:CysZ protein
LRELSHGASYLGRGFGFVRSRPKLLLLGALPALIVFLVLAAVYVTLLVFVGDLVSWATPFADDWPEALRWLTRVLLALAVLVGAFLLFTSVFVGLTLTVGDPFYERIWRETEAALGGPVPDGEVGFVQSVKDGFRLAAMGVVSSVVVLGSGFVPVVGTAAGIVIGVLLSGSLLGRELLGRALGPRGLDDQAQQALLSPYRRRTLGFGVVTQLCFFIPLGGVLVMPAAIAGATMLVRDVLDATPEGVLPPGGYRPDSV